MTTIDCIACVHVDANGNCMLEVTTTSFEDGCCDFAEKQEEVDE